MVSLIQSNYRGMGSGIVPPGLGFMLQDRGELFDLDQGHANTYAPGKRPFHTIIPAFVTKDGAPFMSFGVMGGDMQPQGHVQILMNLVDFGMNLQEAGDAPRLRIDGSSEPTGERMTDGGKVFLETGFPRETVRELDARGHDVRIGRRRLRRLPGDQARPERRVLRRVGVAQGRAGGGLLSFSGGARLHHARQRLQVRHFEVGLRGSTARWHPRRLCRDGDSPTHT